MAASEVEGVAIPVESGEILVLDDLSPRSGPENMARDGALLAEHGSGERLVLRFYRWDGVWRSVGYFQKEREARLRASGAQVVRRSTGGGEVVHDAAEETYALLIPKHHSWGGLTATEVYRQVHEHLASAIFQAGVLSELTKKSMASRKPGACFEDAPVSGDIVELGTGRKIAGAAIRRSNGSVLLQGSVRLNESARSHWQEAFVQRLGRLPDPLDG